MLMAPRALSALVFVVAVALASASPAAESVIERSTRDLLEALEERQMPDVMLWVIDRAASDRAVSDAFKAELPFRRATALVGLSRTEGDPNRRAAILDEAEQSIDAYLAKSPEGDLAITAYLQKATLLIERGKAKVDLARRPGQDAPALSSQAIAFFDTAIRTLKGTVQPGQEIAAVTNAEDAVLKALREVDREIAALKASGKARGRDDAPPRLTAAQQKELEKLEEAQTEYRAKLLSTRILVGAAIYEKSKAYPADSKEAAATLDESTKVFQGIAEKYGSAAAGSFARFYWGRNLAAAGKHGLAAETLAPVVAIDGKSPVAVGLKAKAANTILECWLAMAAAEKDPAQARKILERFDEPLRRFVLTAPEKLPGRKLDSEWLALKYRGAKALDSLAARLDAKERAAKGLLQRDARKLAIEVATANKDYSKEARELATALGRDLPADSGEGKDLAALVADAGIPFASFQEKQAEARQQQAAGNAAGAAAALEQAAAERDAAIPLYERAIQAAESAPQSDPTLLNAARTRLAFLAYDAKRFTDAAAIGELLVEKFPNAVGSRQASRVAIASLQQLAIQPDPAAAKQAKERLVSVATMIAKTWPNDQEGADAMSVLLNTAVESHDADAILEVLAGVPGEAPRRPELAMRAGTAVRREVQDARRLEPSIRPEESTLDRWNMAARGAIDEGLAALEAMPALPAGPAAKSALAAALARVQMALEEGDRERAGRILEHPCYGPWTAVTKGDAAMQQGPLAEGALTVSLRHFIETEQFDKAQRAMDALETSAGTGDEASAKLAGMYLSMGRDLQAQLEALGGARGAHPEVKDRALRLLAGFETFLDRVASRDTKTSSQLWVATTYLTLGTGKGTGSIVPKSKAEQYLDRSAETFGRLLARKNDPAVPEKEREELATFEPSIRLKIASIARERGRWDEAQQHLDWILGDAKRQNTLDMQVQAAELLEAAGRAAASAGDASRADTLLREAAAGRKAGPIVIWGWGGIANKLSRQAFGGTDEKALKAREMFYEARLHVAETLLARARVGGEQTERQKRLDTAKSSIAMTRKLYPDLGGEAFQKRFEKVLREVQREQGAANPGGFVQLDAESAPATPTP